MLKKLALSAAILSLVRPALSASALEDAYGAAAKSVHSYSALLQTGTQLAADFQALKTRAMHSAALEKAHSKVLADGSAVHSFQTLLKLLSTVVRNRCRIPADGSNAPTFDVLTSPTGE